MGIFENTNHFPWFAPETSTLLTHDCVAVTVCVAASTRRTRCWCTSSPLTHFLRTTPFLRAPRTESLSSTSPLARLPRYCALLPSLVTTCMCTYPGQVYTGSPLFATVHLHTVVFYTGSVTMRLWVESRLYSETILLEIIFNSLGTILPACSVCHEVCE